MPVQPVAAAAPRTGDRVKGADADLVIFDPETFRDQATFEKPAVPRTGVRYLLVNGTVVIDRGAIVSGVAPGRALIGTPAQ